MSTSTEMKPQMPSEMMKNAARVYTNQYKLLGYKKVANLIKTQHPEYSLSTKQLKEFFAVKENILPAHVLAADSPVAKKNILRNKLRSRKFSTLKPRKTPRKTPLKQRTNITSFDDNEGEEDDEYNPEEEVEELSEVDTDAEIDDNVEEEIVSDTEFNFNIDITEVQEVKKVITKKKKKRRGKSAKKKSSNKKKKMKARLKKLENTNAKKSLNMNTVTPSFYNINDERLYDDIVEEVDLTAAFLGF